MVVTIYIYIYREVLEKFKEIKVERLKEDEGKSG